MVRFGLPCLDDFSFGLKATNEGKRERMSVWKCGKSGKSIPFYGETLFPAHLPKVIRVSLINYINNGMSQVLFFKIFLVYYNSFIK